MKSRRTFIRSTAVASAGLLASKSFAFSIGKKHLQPDDAKIEYINIINKLLKERKI